MKKPIQFLLMAILMAALTRPVNAQTTTCEYWIAPTGNNANPGTNTLPWATLDYASSQLFKLGKSGCTVWAKEGVYKGANNLGERFSSPVLFKSVTPYKAILENAGLSLEISGARNMVFDGFEFRHSSSTSTALIVYTSRSGSLWAENITFQNNIFHDSYNNDILKIANGSRYVTVINNIFYNQGASDQHIDVNSVTDIVIEGNIFFNDFAGSNRTNLKDTKHFIVIKDSNDNTDGLLGAQRIEVRSNIFLNFQGGVEAFVQIGNDGKPYYEASDIRLINNLMIGNNLDKASAALGIAGAKNITFMNNTVMGDLPSSSYAFRIVTKNLNPQNQNILFYNNIWSDPTGTMNKFSAGTPSMTSGLLLDNNLYWNNNAAITSGDLISPTADAHRIMADPKLNTNLADVLLPRWTGTNFKSGNTSVRQEFIRLVQLYGTTSIGSAAIDKANPAFSAPFDILGTPRGASPDIGAYENPAMSSTLNATTESQTPPTAGDPSATPTITPLPDSTASPTMTPSLPPDSTAAPDLIFSDGFESGDISAWTSNSQNSTGISIQPHPEFDQGPSLFIPTGRDPVYLEDDSPNAEIRYRVRFYFDPNSVSMMNKKNFSIFVGHAGMCDSTPIFSLQIALIESTYQIRMESLTDQDKRETTTWIPINDAPHAIEVEWKAASGVDARNGEINLWVDGNLLANVSGIDNDTQQVDCVRLGAVRGIDAKTSGTLIFDEFVSHRQTYIGP